MVECKPSSVCLFPTVPTPALFIKMSNLSSVSLISLANFRTDCNEVRSRCLVAIFVLWVISIILLLALAPSFLSAMITLAPLEARTRAVSNPMPEKIKNRITQPSHHLVNFSRSGQMLSPQYFSFFKECLKCCPFTIWQYYSILFLLLLLYSLPGCPQ